MTPPAFPRNGPSIHTRMAAKLAKVSNAKFEVEKFDGKNNFGLWQVQVRDVLIQQGLHRALKGLREKLKTCQRKNGRTLTSKHAALFGCVWQKRLCTMLCMRNRLQ